MAAVASAAFDQETLRSAPSAVFAIRGSSGVGVMPASTIDSRPHRVRGPEECADVVQAADVVEQDGDRQPVDRRVGSPSAVAW